MPSLRQILNRLLPFATPGTPFIQDLLHLAVICLALYFAPQIQERFQARAATANAQPVEDGDDRIAQPPQDETAQVQEEPRRGPDIFAFDGPQNDDDIGNHNDAPAERNPNAAGPAHAPDNLPALRNVGAKKAKSLARRDQRRAYNEFMRSQGDATRARDAAGAEEREVALAAERERRRVAEAALEAKKTREREKRRELERQEREVEVRRRERAVELVREQLAQRRMCDLCEVARLVAGKEDQVDSEWLERILVAAGVVGRSSDGTGEMTLVTVTGWAVRVSVEDMNELYEGLAKADAGNDDGLISHEVLSRELEAIIRKRGEMGA